MLMLCYALYVFGLLRYQQQIMYKAHITFQYRECWFLRRASEGCFSHIVFFTFDISFYTSVNTSWKSLVHISLLLGSYLQQFAVQLYNRIYAHFDGNIME